MVRKIGVFRPVLFVEFEKPESLISNPEGFRGRCHFDILWNAVEKNDYGPNGKYGAPIHNTLLETFLFSYPLLNYPEYNKTNIHCHGKVDNRQNMDRQKKLEELTSDQYRSYTFSFTDHRDFNRMAGFLNRFKIDMFERKDFLNKPDQEPTPCSWRALNHSCKKNLAPDISKGGAQYIK